MFTVISSCDLHGMTVGLKGESMNFFNRKVQKIVTVIIAGVMVVSMVLSMIVSYL